MAEEVIKCPNCGRNRVPAFGAPAARPASPAVGHSRPPWRELLHAE